MPGVMPGLFMIGNGLLCSNVTNKAPSDQQESLHGRFDESDADEDVPYENPQTNESARKRAHSTAERTSEKRAKIAAGRPATSKPLTDDLDGEDKRMYELYSQHYKPKDIATKLAIEGYTQYQPGSIASRILRIRRMLEKWQDERLDDDLSDWHDGEDEKLEASVKAADAKFNVELQKLIDKKWNDVAAFLQPQLNGGNKKYTSTACKERWEALQRGNELPPIEFASDPEARKEMREFRIAENKRRRAEERAEAKRAVEAEQEAKAEKKRYRAGKQQEKAQVKLAREAEKAENRRIKAEKHEGKLRKIAERKRAREQWKAEIDEKRRIRELEERVYRQITGKMLNRLRRLPEMDDSIVDSVQGFSDDERFDNADDEEDEVLDNRGDTKNSSDHEEGEAEMPDLTSDREEDQFPDGVDDEDDEDDSGDVNIEASPPLPKYKVSIATLRNPRSIMTDDELAVLLTTRKLTQRGPNESHAEVVARLAAVDSKLTPKELNNLLAPYFYKGRGNREVKIRRLQELDAGDSAAGMKGVTSADEEFMKNYEGWAKYHGGA